MLNVYTVRECVQITRKIIEIFEEYRKLIKQKTQKLDEKGLRRGTVIAWALSALWLSTSGMSTRNTKLYISGLGPTVQQKELYELLARHGKIISLSVKNNYAFVVSGSSFYLH